MVEELRDGETSYDYLSRIVEILKFEDSEILNALPSITAIIEYFELTQKYDTDLMSGIIDSLENGESPKHYNKFVKKYKLNWFLYGE